MRFKKIAPKNNNWTKTSQVLQELFETLHCSKCKSSLHDSQQFLKCGHFSCFSCIKNKSSCIECQCSVNDDILKDDTMRKILEACCTIAEQVGFKLLSPNGQATSKGNSSKDEKNSHIELGNSSSLSNNGKGEFNGTQDEPGRNLTKRKGVKKLTEIVTKKAKSEKIIPIFRVPKNVDKKNHVGETKLQEECKKGRIDNVRTLLDAGANPNTFCAAGWTPLQECADYGFIEIAKLLIEKGADVNKKGHQGQTPLHQATEADRLSMVKFLLEQNAQKNIVDDYFKKPIAYCKSKEIKMLLEDVEIRSPRMNRRTRISYSSSNEISDNSPGVSNNAPDESQYVSVRKKNPLSNKRCDYSPGVSNDAPEKSNHAHVRINNPPPNNVCNNSPGVSKTTPEKSHHVSARNTVKVEKYNDSSTSESEDDVVVKDERYSQNITICHQQYENDTFDTEEIDILN